MSPDAPTLDVMSAILVAVIIFAAGQAVLLLVLKPAQKVQFIIGQIAGALLLYKQISEEIQ